MRIGVSDPSSYSEGFAFDIITIFQESLRHSLSRTDFDLMTSNLEFEPVELGDRFSDRGGNGDFAVASLTPTTSTRNSLSPIIIFTKNSDWMADLRSDKDR